MPDLHDFLLTTVILLGVVFLMFGVGLEMDPEKLWSMRRWRLGLGTLQVLLTGALITVVMLWLGSEWEVAVVGGPGLALSSTAICMQILKQRGEQATSHGEAAFAVLVLQDLAVVPLLALVPLLAGHEAPGASEPLVIALPKVVAAVYPCRPPGDPGLHTEPAS